MSANDVQHGGEHYKTQAIQVWDYITSNGIPYLEGNAIKYLSRWRAKGGLQDLLKAKHYVEKLIELETEAAKALKNQAKPTTWEVVISTTGADGKGTATHYAGPPDNKSGPLKKLKTVIQEAQDEKWEYAPPDPKELLQRVDQLLVSTLSYGKTLAALEINETGMILDLLAAVAKLNKEGSRLASPDYRATEFYSSQWRRHGALQYWQYKKEHPLAAKVDLPGGKSVCFFNPKGLELNALVWFTEKTR